MAESLQGLKFEHCSPKWLNHFRKLEVTAAVNPPCTAIWSTPLISAQLLGNLGYALQHKHTILQLSLQSYKCKQAPDTFCSINPQLDLRLNNQGATSHQIEAIAVYPSVLTALSGVRMENICAYINRETQNASAKLTEEACTNHMKTVANL